MSRDHPAAVRVATEEAFATREQLDMFRKVADAGEPSADMIFWRRMLAPGNESALGALLDIDEGRIAGMDAHGVTMQVLSLTSPGVQVFSADAASGLARSSNDELAEAVARRPGRFAGLAAIAPQDPREAAREMERAVTRLGLCGFIVNSHTHGEYLDQEKFHPILEAAEALGRPIYIHPRTLPDAAIGPYMDHNLWTAMWGYAAETSLHAMRMLASGVFDRFPRLKIVLGHMGEGLPYWLYRLDYMYAVTSRREPRKLELKPSEYIQRNMDATRYALGIDDVRRERFIPNTRDHDAVDLTGYEPTMRNVRLWDPAERVALQSFDQLQSIRDYYDISDVDVGRYARHAVKHAGEPSAHDEVHIMPR
jgi:5-carboxyvanillate decarboxylase